MIFNFDSTMTGAPVLSGVAGALRGVLKSCLVDGFGAGAVATLSVANGVATATFPGAHPYRSDTVTQIAGATPAALNGIKRVLSLAADRITFDATGIPDGVATGSITHKVAAAGWQELFAGQVANIIVLKPTVVEATGCLVRIDDRGTTTARVNGYESMSDVNTGSGVFPTATQKAGGQYWWKSVQASAVARPWRLYADERCFFFWVASGSVDRGVLHYFGDLVSDKSGDAWCAALNGLDATPETSSPQYGCVGFGQATSAPFSDFVVARSHAGVGGAQFAKKVGAHNPSVGYSGTLAYNGNALVFPNGADNSLRLSSIEVLTTGTIRGRMPGLYHCPQQVAAAFSTGDVVDGSGPYQGRRFVALCVGPSSGTSVGVAFVDAFGSWR